MGDQHSSLLLFLLLFSVFFFCLWPVGCQQGGAAARFFHVGGTQQGREMFAGDEDSLGDFSVSNGLINPLKGDAPTKPCRESVSTEVRTIGCLLPLLLLLFPLLH